MVDSLLQSPYKTLNIPEDASDATIKRAFKKLAFWCHPDRVKDETEKEQKAEQFHQIQLANEILADPLTRQNYDEKIKLQKLRAGTTEPTAPSRNFREFETLPEVSTPRFELRGNPMYEARDPTRSQYVKSEGSIFSTFSNYSNSHQDKQGYQAIRSHLLHAGYPSTGFSIYSHGSSDSGFATRPPSVDEPKLHWSHLTRNDNPEDQLRGRSADYFGGIHGSLDTEAGHTGPLSSSKERRLR